MYQKIVKTVINSYFKQLFMRFPTHGHLSQFKFKKLANILGTL